MKQLKENAEIGRTFCRTGVIFLYIAANIMVITNRKEGLHLNFHDDIEYIWIHINMISFSFLYGSK